MIGQVMIFYFCSMDKKRLAIFASGNGSNAVRIIDYFKGHAEIEVAVILTNNKEAGVLKRTVDEPIKQLIINNDEAKQGEYLLSLMKEHHIDFIILSGYLRLVPQALIQAFEERIINIHPALLPKYGGAGMYGIHVHKAVKEAQEKESGISIHVVSEKYDKGEVIAQHRVALEKNDSPEDIQKKVQVLEHKYFALEVEKYVLTK